MADDDVLSFSDFIKPDETFEFIKNSLKEIDNSLHKVMGSAKIFAEILDEDVRAGGKNLKEAAEAVDWLRKSYVALAKTQTETGKIGIALNEIVKQEGKIQGAEAKQIVNAAGSYYQLAAALEEAETKYKMLSEDERKWSAVGKDLLSDIKNLRAQIGEFNREVGNIGLVTTEDKLKAQIANLQKEGQVMADLRQQVASLKAAQKGLAEGKFFSPEGMSQAAQLRTDFAFLNSMLKTGQISQKEYDEQVKKIIADTQRLISIEKQLGKSYQLQKIAEQGQGVKVSRSGTGFLYDVQVADATKLSYEQLTAVYELATEALRSYNAEQLQTDETAKKLIETQANTVTQLNKFDQATGKVSRQWDGLRMQVTQVVRELPSMAISANTFFLAISNNIPYLADEIRQARLENEELTKSGQKAIPVWKQIGKALVSWNTILVAILTVFSIWGRDIINWTKSLFGVRDAITSVSEAMKKINEEAVKHNDDYAKQATLLKALTSIWQQLTTQEERIKFVEQYQDKFKELGVSITSVNDAENLFVEHTDDMLKALKLRAQQAAAQAKIEEEYKKIIEQQFNIEDAKIRIEEATEELKPLKEELEAIRTLYGSSVKEEALKGKISLLEDEIEKLTKKVNKNTEGIKDEVQSIETYQKAYERLLKGERDVLDEAGIKSAKEAKKQKDLINRLNQEQLNALKRRNELEEAIMEDGYSKNVKKIKDGYKEERKEIQKQIDSIKSLLKKEWGLVMGTSNLDNIDPTAKAFVELIAELAKQLEIVNDAEKADLGKEWLAEQTRRAQAAKDAVQLRIDAVKAGSEEEYKLKMELIWKEYAAEIAANKEKEQTKRQDSLAIYEKYLKKESDLRNAHEKEMRERQIKQLELEIGSTAYGREASTKTEQKIELQRKQALADIEQSGLNAEEQEAKRLATEQYYDRLILQERIKLANQLVKVEKDLVSIETDLAQKNSAEKLRLLLEQNNLAEQSELNNAYLSATSEEEYAEMADHIIQKYKQLESFIKGDFAIKVLDDQQALAEAIFNIVEQTEQDITRFELEQERERWIEQIRLAEAGMLDWSETQIAAAKATVEGINNQLKRLEGIGGVLSRISEHGLLGLFDMTDEQYDAWKNYADFIGDQIDKIIDKYVELAQAAVDAQQQQVDAARTVYEAELEARANGYANNVETAKKELQLQKQTLKEKQKRLEEAERYQRIADEASTASSLITAIAQLYKAYAGVPYVGLIIAAAAVTGLLGMFAAGKASAKAAASQNYGGGGFELLQGGSHASGNDIDLGVRNRHNRRMRAEGGESMAIFSRRATKRYSEVLPDLVASINKGNFEEQYSQSFVLPDEVKLGIGKERYVDLSKIEGSLDQLTSQGAEQYSIMPDGTVIIKKGNVTKIIKK